MCVGYCRRCCCCCWYSTLNSSAVSLWSGVGDGPNLDGKNGDTQRDAERVVLNSRNACQRWAAVAVTAAAATAIAAAAAAALVAAAVVAATVAAAALSAKAAVVAVLANRSMRVPGGSRIPSTLRIVGYNGRWRRMRIRQLPQSSGVGRSEVSPSFLPSLFPVSDCRVCAPCTCPGGGASGEVQSGGGGVARAERRPRVGGHHARDRTRRRQALGRRGGAEGVGKKGELLVFF